jgi:hypothetical protein
LYSVTVLHRPYPVNQHKLHRMDNPLNDVNPRSHKERPLLLISQQDGSRGYQEKPLKQRYRWTVNIDGRAHCCADLNFAHTCLAGEVNAA